MIIPNLKKRIPKILQEKRKLLHADPTKRVWRTQSKGFIPFEEKPKNLQKLNYSRQSEVYLLQKKVAGILKARFGDSAGSVVYFMKGKTNYFAVVSGAKIAENKYFRITNKKVIQALKHITAEKSKKT